MPSSKFYPAEKLYCTLCSVPVSTKLDTLKDHLKSKRHLASRSKGQRKRQLACPLVTTERADFVVDLVRTLCEADIPLFRMQKLRGFLTRHCVCGGLTQPHFSFFPGEACTPHETTARKVWVPKAFAAHMDEIREVLRGRKVFVAFDDSTLLRTHLSHYYGNEHMVPTRPLPRVRMPPPVLFSAKTVEGLVSPRWAVNCRCFRRRRRQKRVHHFSFVGVSEKKPGRVTFFWVGCEESFRG